MQKRLGEQYTIAGSNPWYQENNSRSTAARKQGETQEPSCRVLSDLGDLHDWEGGFGPAIGMAAAKHHRDQGGAGLTGQMGAILGKSEALPRAHSIQTWPALI